MSNLDSQNSPNYSEEEGTSRSSNPFRFLLYIVIIVGLVFIYFLFNNNSNLTLINWEKFNHEMLHDNDVEKVDIVNNEIAEVYIKKESLRKAKYNSVSTGFWGYVNNGPHFYFAIGSVDLFEKKLDAAQAGLLEKDKLVVDYVKRESYLPKLFSWTFPILLFIFLWFFIIRRITSGVGRTSGSIFDFGRSNPKLYEKGKYSNITFKDLAGYEEAKVEVMEIVDFLKHPENYTKLGAKIPKGILLVGAPGTGKTLMAKAVAGEAEVPFFSLSGSEFIEMFVGVGASRVRDLFEKAKRKAPSIIFIDEIDTIGRLRSKAVSFQANDERDSTLNQLLAELDGFDPNTGVIVLAATNRADILDPALLRAGRFDRHIYLELPNKQERIAIFGVHIKSLVIDKNVDVNYLATQTPGFSGADIANVCNEAALIAARKKKLSIDTQDFFDAIDRMMAGIEKKSKLISPIEKNIIAYHEAGHAVVSWFLKNIDSLQKVSIIPRGKSLGGAWYLPEERQIITYSQFFDFICAALGGRVAEEIVFNEASSGALDDLEKITKQAYMMVANLGLSKKIGLVSFYDSTGEYQSSIQKPYSEATAMLIDDEVRKIIEDARIIAKNLLELNRKKLDDLSKRLLEKEVVYKSDLEEVLGKRTFTV